MQSGKERRNFSLSGQVLGDVKIQNNGVRKKSVKLQKQEKTIRAVTGLATDTLNTRVVASTLEGVLYVSSNLPFVVNIPDLHLSSSIFTIQNCSQHYPFPLQ